MFVCVYVYIYTDLTHLNDNLTLGYQARQHRAKKIHGETGGGKRDRKKTLTMTNDLSDLSSFLISMDIRVQTLRLGTFFTYTSFATV